MQRARVYDAFTHSLLLLLAEPINMIGVMPDDDASQKPPVPVPALARVPISTPANTVEFKLRPETIRDLVRKLAADTGNIKWSKHAQERMFERGISDKYVLDALRQGVLKGAIEAGENPGEWKVKMTHRAKGRREVGVVVIVVRSAYLLVKTTEWEDLS